MLDSGVAVLNAKVDGALAAGDLGWGQVQSSLHVTDKNYDLTIEN